MCCTICANFSKIRGEIAEHHKIMSQKNVVKIYRLYLSALENGVLAWDAGLASMVLDVIFTSSVPCLAAGPS